MCMCICTHHIKEAILLPRYLILAMGKVACMHYQLDRKSIWVGICCETFRIWTAVDPSVTGSWAVTRQLEREFELK